MCIRDSLNAYSFDGELQRAQLEPNPDRRHLDVQWTGQDWAGLHTSLARPVLGANNKLAACRF
eukprot:6468149-Alexandrium_andersonii.AAC.1